MCRTRRALHYAFLARVKRRARCSLRGHAWSVAAPNRSRSGAPRRARRNERRRRKNFISTRAMPPTRSSSSSEHARNRQRRVRATPLAYTLFSTPGRPRAVRDASACVLDDRSRDGARQRERTCLHSALGIGPALTRSDHRHRSAARRKRARNTIRHSVAGERVRLRVRAPPKEQSPMISQAVVLRF